MNRVHHVIKTITLFDAIFYNRYVYFWIQYAICSTVWWKPSTNEMQTQLGILREMFLEHGWLLVGCRHPSCSPELNRIFSNRTISKPECRQTSSPNFKSPEGEVMTKAVVAVPFDTTILPRNALLQSIAKTRARKTSDVVFKTNQYETVSSIYTLRISKY